MNKSFKIQTQIIQHTIRIKSKKNFKVNTRNMSQTRLTKLNRKYKHKRQFELNMKWKSSRKRKQKNKTLKLRNYYNKQIG